MNSKQKKRKDIESQFLDTNDVILKVGLTDAVITNQKLILEVLLDIRDSLHEIKRSKTSAPFGAG
jgi:hypothetical protein